MPNYKKLFTDFMDREGIIYTNVDDYAVRVSYSGDNLKSIPVIVIFDKDGDPLVQLVCMEIASFKGKEGNGIFTCNLLNSKYRWAKFFIDDDSDTVVSVDACIDEYTCGPECLALVGRIVSITDEAYPELAKALWG